MMAGDGPHNVAMLNNGAVRVNMSNVDSPLQIFVRAKKKINDIFVEIDDYVKDAVTFMHGKCSNIYVRSNRNKQHKLLLSCQ